MTDKKTSALTEVTTPSAADVFLALVSSASKKITYANLRPITQTIANLALSSDSIQSTTLAASGQGQCILLLCKLDGAAPGTKSVKYWIDNEYQGAVDMAEAVIAAQVSNSAVITVADASDFAVGDVVLVRDDTYDQGYTNALRYRIITTIASGDVITVDSAVTVPATTGTLSTVKSINTWYYSGCVLKTYTTPDSFNLLKDLVLC